VALVTLAPGPRRVWADQAPSVSVAACDGAPLAIVELTSADRKRWLETLEIRVRNVGTKPLVGATLELRFDEVPGVTTGATFSFGFQAEALSADPLAASSPPTLRPGAEVTVSLSATSVEAYQLAFDAAGAPLPATATAQPIWAAFADATEWRGAGASCPSRTIEVRVVAPPRVGSSVDAPVSGGSDGRT